MAPRSQYSIRLSLIEKAKEAALTAVQAYNNPLTRFKSESFIVLMMVAWTYLLHAHYRQTGVEYRHYERAGKRRRFQRNPNGTERYWDLMTCVGAAAWAMATEQSGCVASGGQTPSQFFASRDEALASFDHNFRLPAPPGREFDKTADEAIRVAVASLLDALPAAPADGVHPVALNGRPVGNVVITESADGWAVTDYEIEVPLEVCELAKRRAGG
ncbi:MAG TPA: DUF3644 domain-containing protein [Propionibacteriaceae bacterium]|nr:DUF3644 domain-containing protein [Propionibacteriaceae bacterium]